MTTKPLFKPKAARVGGVAFVARNLRGLMRQLGKPIQLDKAKKVQA